MRIYFPNMWECWPEFLSVYVIMRYNLSNVLYKLNYFGGAVITLKVRHCQYNNISSINNLGVCLMLPPAVRSNDPVRLKYQFYKEKDVTVLLGLLQNLNSQPFFGYDKEVY